MLNYTTKLKNLGKGDLFKLSDDNCVFVKGCYDRSSKSYLCYRCGDLSTPCFIEGNKYVFIYFTF